MSYMTSKLHYELKFKYIRNILNYCQHQLLHHIGKYRLLELMTPSIYNEISLQFQMSYN